MTALTRGAVIGIARMNLELAREQWAERFPTASWTVRPAWNAKDREERESLRRYIFSLEDRIARLEGPARQPDPRRKVCITCREEKSWDDFHIRKSSGRPASECRVCVRKRWKEWQQKRGKR